MVAEVKEAFQRVLVFLAQALGAITGVLAGLFFLAVMALFLLWLFGGLDSVRLLLSGIF